MKYLAFFLKSPFIALKWAILLPLIIVVIVIDRFTSGGCSAFLNDLGRNVTSSGTHTAYDEDSDDSPFHSSHRDVSDSGVAYDSGPSFNVDGSPMLGDTDIHGNSFGMAGGFEDSFSSFEDSSSMFDDDFSSCGNSCFGD
jgi:hypothetical protein